MKSTRSEEKAIVLEAGDASRTEKKSAVEEEVRSSGAIGRVSLVTFVSRVLGLVREQVKAYFLGTGAAADAFTVGFMVPNLLRRFLAEGVMSAAVVPVFTEYLGDGERAKEEARRFVSILFGVLLFVVAVVVAAGTAFAPVYIPLFFATFGPEKAHLTSVLTALMFPYIGFVSIASLFQGILNCHGRFSLPALCPVALNAIVIGTGCLLAPRGNDPAAQAEAARILALSVLVGGFAQAAMLVPALRRLGYGLRPRLSLAHAGLRRCVGLILPVVMGGGIHQINALVSIVLAAYVSVDGAVAALSYSQRLLELALGIFVLSVLTVALPGLARLWQGETKERYFAQAAFALKLVLLVSVPAGFGLLFLDREVITVLFSFGAFGRDSVNLTETALRFHALSVPLTACARCFSQCFYAARDSRVPLRIGVWMAATNILLCFALGYPLAHGGIALALTVSTGLGVVLYARAWFRKHGRGTLEGVLSFAIRVVVAGLLMGLFHLAWTNFVAPFPEGGRRVAMMLHLAGALFLDVGFFFLMARALGLREVDALVATLLGRRRGAGSA